MRIQKKSVPFTDNLWVAGVDLKSCGFSALLVRLREDGRRSSSRVPWQQSVPMAPLRAPLCSQPGGTHPPRQDERCPPGPEPVAVFFCAQVEAENSLPTVAFPRLSVLGGPGVLVIGTRKDPEYLGLLPQSAVQAHHSQTLAWRVRSPCTASQAAS